MDTSRQYTARMTRRHEVVYVLLVLAIAAGLATAALNGRHVQRPAPAQMVAGPCRAHGAGVMVVPDDACTPGAFLPLTRAQACAHKDHPPTPEGALRRRILAPYGVTRWTGRDGELDHRVPVWLGGLTDERNVWPEPGRIPNPKDRLEYGPGSVHDLVCEQHVMTVQQARRIFLGNWVAAYHRLGLG